MKRLLLCTICTVVFWIVVSVVHAIADMPSSVPTPTSQAADTGKALLEYSKFYRDESARHQDFLERLYDKLVKLLAGIVIVFGAVITWLHWKTRKEIEEQVNSRIDSIAKGAIDLRLKVFDEQLQVVRTDLDNQVKAIKKNMDEQVRDINQVMFAPEHRGRPQSQRPPSSADRQRSILWVDDYPENNDMPAEILRSNGIKIFPVLSTEEAIEAIETRSFDLIISDMGRGENRTAGLDLLRVLREKAIKTPTIIFASTKAISRFGPEARKLGAVTATSGMTSLLDAALTILAGIGNHGRIEQ
jgi:CheY-like chemotaxis protein